MNHHYICIDWGGSELKGTCLSAAGCCKEFSFSAGNLRLLNEERLREICERLCGEISESGATSVIWLIGAAGADDNAAAGRLMKMLEACCKTTTAVHIFSDYACNHAACLAGEDGILSINGTGSVLYAVHADKKIRTGGWGFLLDETPSGAYFGRCALQGVLRHIEGESDYQDYYQAFCSRFGEPSRQRIIDELYRSPSLQRQLGSYATILTTAFAQNNARARQAVNYSIQLLVESCVRLAAAVGAGQLQFCGSGGLWANWPEFYTLTGEEMQRQNASFSITRPALSLHYGPLINFARTDVAAKKLVEKLKSTGDL